MYELKLKQIRREKGLYQKDLAALLDGVSVRMISSWETGETDISLIDAVRVAAALGVSLYELSGTTPPETDAASRIANSVSKLDPIGQAKIEGYIEGLSDAR